MNASELHDFKRQVGEMQSHNWTRVVMWPRLWSEFKTPANHVWHWDSVPLEKSCSNAVPDDQHGVYTLTIAPPVARHPLLYFVTYVGKADKMTLQARFLSYFNEKQNLKRPHITLFLDQYDGFIKFSFCPVTDVSKISYIERELITALVPPLCKDLPAKVSPMVRAFH